MLSNSSLQPWFDYGASSGPDDFAALPPIQPCYGAVNCSVVCDTPYFLFDPHHPSNLVTCGLWATVSAGLEQSGLFPTTTPFDAVGLNISAIESIEIDDGGLAVASVQALQENLVDCFASFYAATHSLTDNIQSSPKTCSGNAIFLYPGIRVEPCFLDLCAHRSLDADLGGIGVCSTKLYSVRIRH